MNSEMNGAPQGPGMMMHRGGRGGGMMMRGGRGGPRGGGIGVGRFNNGPGEQNRPPPANPPIINKPPPNQPEQQAENKEIKQEPQENRNGPGPNRGIGMGGPMRGGPGGNRYPRRDDQQRGMPKSQDERLMDRVAALGGPTYDLPPQDDKERKFNGHCRLYVGNLTNDTTEEEVSSLFTSYGETSELFLNKEKNFAFIRLDYRASAEKAKRELDGSLRKGRQLKVRFAPHTAAVKVKNLTTHVSNELLEAAFAVFGEVERAYIIVDERGKSQCEGIVEFARKPGAQLAIRKCTEQCYFITASLRPVICEQHDELDDPDGLPDKNMFKKSPDFQKSREVGPRFASLNSFEHDYGTRWKQLFELKKQKLEALEREMKLEEEKLEAQMEYAKYEHETEMLRQQLRQREADRDRQKRDWELKERQQEEQRIKEEEMMRRKQEDMQMRIMRQEEEMRRRQQENSLFMQAHQLNSLLDQQEQAMRGGNPGGGSGGPGGYNNMGRGEYDQPPMQDNFRGPGGPGPGNLPVDPKAFMDSFDHQGGGRGGYDMNDMGGRNQMNRPPPRWGAGGQPQDRRPPPPVMDDYPNKRRRY